MSVLCNRFPKTFKLSSSLGCSHFQLLETPSPFLELLLPFWHPFICLCDVLVIRSIPCPPSLTTCLLKRQDQIPTRFGSLGRSLSSFGQPKEYSDPPGNALSFGSPMASPVVASLHPQLVPGKDSPRQTLQDAAGGGEAGGTTPAHSNMSAHKDSTASSRSICTSLVSSSGML